MPRYYLSGPMSGIAEDNFPAFRDAADDLRNRGMQIVSPHENPPMGAYADYIRVDLELLAKVNGGIVLLPGWVRSTGAFMELHIARTLNLPVYFYRGRGHDLVDMQRGVD